MTDDDPVLASRLSVLRPQVDVDAGRANVLRESLRRRRRDRIATVAAVVVAFVLLGGAVASVARGQGHDGADLVVGGRTATSTPPLTGAPVAPAPGPSAAGTSIDEGTSTSTSSSTTTTGLDPQSSLLPPAASTTAPTTTQVPQADVVLTIQPDATSVRPGDRAFVKVAVTNRGTAPALYNNPFCGAGPAPVTVSTVPVPPPMMDYVGRPSMGRLPDWDAVVAGNALSGPQLVEADKLDQPDGTYCATIGSPPLSLAPGETVQARVGWDVRLQPGELPTPHTLFYFANFDVPEPGQATTAVHASVPFTVEADPSMDGTGAPAYAAATRDPVVQQWLSGIQQSPMLITVWFGRGEWVFVFTGINWPTLVVVRVDPATSEVRSASAPQALPRI